MTETIWIITWLVICPVCDLEYKDIQEINSTNLGYRASYKYTDRNIIECQKCHVALFAQPEKIVKKTYDLFFTKEFTFCPIL